MSHIQESASKTSYSFAPLADSSLNSPLFPAGVSFGDAASAGFSLEKRLLDISHKHPFNSATMIYLEHQQIVFDYQAPGELVADYLSYKYSTEKPKGFLLWYVDTQKNHIQQEKQTTYVQGGCGVPKVFDPHKFP